MPASQEAVEGRVLKNRPEGPGGELVGFIVNSDCSFEMPRLPALSHDR